MSKATLSVVMSSYNYGQYIGEALEAIVGQSLRPFEVIVLDDASTDNSVEIINEFVRRDPIVKLVRHERNLGVLEVMKVGISLATGEYLYGAAADDRILPRFFEKSVSLLEQYPQAGLCSADMGCLDKDGNDIGEYRAGVVEQASFLSPPEILTALYKDPAYIIGGSTVFRRSALDEAGDFPPQLLSLCDWFIERAIALKHGACYIPEVLYLWRVAESQYSATCNRDPWGMLEVVDQAVDLMQSPRYRETFPPEFVEFWCSRFGGEVIDGALAILTERQYAFMEQIGRCVEPSGLLNRLLRRTLWTMSKASLSVSRTSLRRRLRPIQKKSGARLNQKNN
jgi:glycosyltransferase involved in cell wall biosynthesis